MSNNVISFLDKIKQREQESAERTTQLLKRAKQLNDSGATEFCDRVMSLAEQELNKTKDLRRLVLDIEHPAQKITSIRISTAPIESPRPIDITPSVTPSLS